MKALTTKIGISPSQKEVRNKINDLSKRHNQNPIIYQFQSSFEPNSKL